MELIDLFVKVHTYYKVLLIKIKGEIIMNKITLLNPLEQIPHLFTFDGFEGKNFRLGHIIYDESMDSDYDYQIIRYKSHDGTYIFTQQLIAEALKPLVNSTTYCIKDHTDDEMKDIAEIEYTIGNIKLESEYGKIKTGAGEIGGVTNTVSIPVRCKYTFKNQGLKQ